MVGCASVNLSSLDAEEIDRWRVRDQQESSKCNRSCLAVPAVTVDRSVLYVSCYVMLLFVCIQVYMLSYVVSHILFN